MMVIGVCSADIKLMMRLQKQEQKIKTIDLNDFLDGFHNYRTNAASDREALKSHPFAVKLRSHLNARAETCFSIQACTPHSRQSSRRQPSRYESARTGREEGGSGVGNIGVEEFAQAVLGREEGEQAREFMRSLNGTWFQSSPDHFRTAMMHNTLGIKKSRSAARPRPDRYNPELLRDRVDFSRQFRQGGLFPSRKSHQQRIKKLGRSPSHGQAAGSPCKLSEGSLKFQIIRSIRQELEGKAVPRGSVRAPKTQGSPLSNERLAVRGGQAVVTGTRMQLHE